MRNQIEALNKEKKTYIGLNAEYLQKIKITNEKLQKDEKVVVDKCAGQMLQAKRRNGILL